MAVCCGIADLKLCSPLSNAFLEVLKQRFTKLAYCLQQDFIEAIMMEAIDIRVDNTQQNNCTSSHKYEAKNQFVGVIGSFTINLHMKIIENRKRPTTTSHMEVRPKNVAGETKTTWRL